MAQLTLTDAASLSWDISVDDTALLTATVGVGNIRTLPNTILSNGVNGQNYQLTFIQDSIGNREISFEDDFSVIGKFNKAANARTIITFVVQNGKADVVLSSLIDDNIGERDFVASGTIGSGVVVGLRSDGTVEIIKETIISGDYGTPVVFESANTINISSTFDSNTNRIVIAYSDNGNSSFGTAIVGEVSGSTITFGSPTVFNSANTQYISAISDSNTNRVVISYQDLGNSSFGTAIVGEVTGGGTNSISFGAESVFNSANTQYIESIFDFNTNRVAMFYRDLGNSSFGTAIVGEVTGGGTNSISFGAESVFNSADSTNIGSTFDTLNNKIVIGYNDGGNGGFGTSVVSTITGGATNTISHGTPVIYENANSRPNKLAFDSSVNRVVIAYKDVGNSSRGTAIIGEVTGTTIAFGSPTIFNSTGDTTYINIIFDSSIEKIVIFYQDAQITQYGTSIVGTVIGGVTNSISFDSEIIFESAVTSHISATFDINSNNIVVTYRDEGNSNFGTAIILTPELATTNVLTTIGINTTSKTNGQTVIITTIAGTNDKQFGLTIGDLYYVDYQGNITKTPNQSFDFEPLGIAVSVNEILKN